MPRFGEPKSRLGVPSLGLGALSIDLDPNCGLGCLVEMHGLGCLVEMHGSTSVLKPPAGQPGMPCCGCLTIGQLEHVAALPASRSPIGQQAAPPPAA